MMGVGAFLGWETMLGHHLALRAPDSLRTGRPDREATLGQLPSCAPVDHAQGQGVDAGERPEPTIMPFGPLLAAAVPIAMYTSSLDFFR